MNEKKGQEVGVITVSASSFKIMILTITEISKENHACITCCENSKSSIMLLCPITPHAATLALITKHTDNLGLITQHGKLLCHLGETQERTGRSQAAQTWGLWSSASSGTSAVWWPPSPPVRSWELVRGHLTPVVFLVLFVRTMCLLTRCVPWKYLSRIVARYTTPLEGLLLEFFSECATRIVELY